MFLKVPHILLCDTAYLHAELVVAGDLDVEVMIEEVANHLLPAAVDADVELGELELFLVDEAVFVAVELIEVSLEPLDQIGRTEDVYEIILQIAGAQFNILDLWIISESGIHGSGESIITSFFCLCQSAMPGIESGQLNARQKGQAQKLAVGNDNILLRQLLMIDGTSRLERSREVCFVLSQRQRVGGGNRSSEIGFCGAVVTRLFEIFGALRLNAGLELAFALPASRFNSSLW